MAGLEEQIKKLALDSGAASVGISTVDRLGSEPSMDPNYVLPGARSLVSFYIPLDGDIIRRFLGKEDQEAMEDHDAQVYKRLFRIGEKIKGLLESEGFKAAVPEPNVDYRHKDSKEYKRISYKRRQGFVDWMAKGGNRVNNALRKKLAPTLADHFMKNDWNLTPSFSHRYGAVAAGLGSIGWSGNVMTPEYGSRVYLETVLTDAELKSDPMLEENPCDGCRICVKVCQAGFINMKEKDSVTIGGREFVHNKKGHNLRCTIVCAGFSGQSKYKGWSTWSPGRFELPEDQQELERAWREFMAKNLGRNNWYSHVLGNVIHHTEYGMIRRLEKRHRVTCGNCQLVCWKTRQERLENYDILVESGEILEGPGFTFVRAKNRI